MLLAAIVEEEKLKTGTITIAAAITGQGPLKQSRGG